MNATTISRDPLGLALATVLVVGLATIGGALFFEHVIGLEPCALCYKGRWVYYAGLPVTALGLVLWARGQTRLAALIAVAVALGFLANLGLSVYHVGVEQKLWAGPTTCSGAAPATDGGFAAFQSRLAPQNAVKIVRCDEIQWQLFGISLAGYNALISIGLAALCLRAVVKGRTT